jgi:catechol 2,3-dioxygenase
MIMNLNKSINQSLPTDLSLGAVELHVHDLEALKVFYTNVIGLDVLTNTNDKYVLGHQSQPIVTLIKKTEFEKAAPHHAGLYHLAILFSSRGELARALFRVLEMTPDLFSGSADHLVSEAFYLTDPERNGIELYYDRDRSAWKWDNGQIQMASIYLDPREYINKYLSEGKDEQTKKIGHVHLKVGNINEAYQFYVKSLGFDVTAQLPGALFISVGGYHHHLGLNIWESQGYGKRPETLGLKGFRLILPSKEAIHSLVQRLEHEGIPIHSKDQELFILDPWNNQVLIETK